jgi:hypothetical protein
VGKRGIGGEGHGMEKIRAEERRSLTEARRIRGERISKRKGCRKKERKWKRARNWGLEKNWEEKGRLENEAGKRGRR